MWRTRGPASRPLGNASSMCTATAMHTELSASPRLKSSGAFAATSAVAKNEKPTPTMSGPIRFSGRRAHAKRPVPIQAAMTTPMRAASSAGLSSMSLVATIAISAPMSARPRAAMPASARRRPITPRAPAPRGR